MLVLVQVFLETDYYEGTARQQRDLHAAELTARGYDCRCKTLYRVPDGMPVYVVEAEMPEPLEDPNSYSAKLVPYIRDNMTPRRVPDFEVR